VTDGNASVVHATSQQACPVRDGAVGMEKLPAAESRTVAFAILRNIGPGSRDANGAYLITEADTALIDTLVGLAGRPCACLGAGLARLEMRVLAEKRHRRIPAYHVRKGTSAWPDWPSGLIGIDSLPLNFPAEGTRLADREAEGELWPPSCAGSAGSRFGFCLR
jgi:hypothetical protein